jgi:hypothetical protein
LKRFGSAPSIISDVSEDANDDNTFHIRLKSARSIRPVGFIEANSTHVVGTLTALRCYDGRAEVSFSIQSSIGFLRCVRPRHDHDDLVWNSVGNDKFTPSGKLSFFCGASPLQSKGGTRHDSTRKM